MFYILSLPSATSAFTPEVDALTEACTHLESLTNQQRDDAQFLININPGYRTGTPIEYVCSH